MQPRRCSRLHGSAICRQFELFVRWQRHLESILMMLMMMLLLMVMINININRNTRCMSAMQLQRHVFLPLLLLQTLFQKRFR